MTLEGASIRRSPYTLFYYEDGTFPDFTRIMRGAAVLERRRIVYALSILSGETYPLDPETVPFLTEIPSDGWMPVTDLLQRWPDMVPSMLDRWSSYGLILLDPPGEVTAKLLRRYETLSSEGWNLFAALYHFMTRWSGVDFSEVQSARQTGQSSAESGPVASLLAHYGPPPPHFCDRGDTSARRELPLPHLDDGVFRLFTDRKTTRYYDRTRALEARHLSLLLYSVFGCSGYSRIDDEIVTVKKSSPSGGGLHPIEVYPLVINVDGIESGLYHYHVGEHSLDPIEQLTVDGARELARKFAAGQRYVGDAGVVFTLAARFYRNYWKYRKNPRAYAVILMDAAHLSQSLYLACAQLGLGAFVTAAINSRDIDQHLGIDGYREGAVLVCGCGVRSGEHGNQEPAFLDYRPRHTAI